MNILLIQPHKAAIAFGDEVERHIPDDSHMLLHQHGVGHHH